MGEGGGMETEEGGSGQKAEEEMKSVAFYLPQSLGDHTPSSMITGIMEGERSELAPPP